MISPSKRITATSLERQAKRSDTEDLTGGIKNEGQQVKSGHSIPLIEDLEIDSIFKDEAEEEKASVTDLKILVVLVTRLLR
jgi:hypothetical protein